MRVSEVISAIEAFANPSLQEPWDNTGLQVGFPSAECTGVLVSFDPTPEAVAEAIAKGCNLVVTHHPLFFRAVKSLTGATAVEQTAINAIAAGVSIYSSHTAADSAIDGVSYALARRIGVEPRIPLSAPGGKADAAGGEGLGLYGVCTLGLDAGAFALHVKERLGCRAVRTSKVNFAPGEAISRVAVCGGAGGEFIAKALSLGAQAYVTADVRYHDFVDYRDKILLIDAGHFETEEAVKEIFAKVISERFPGLPVHCTSTNDNPINYI